MNNKARIDSYIPVAIDALSESRIEKGGKVNSSYRSQISSFGAAVTIGSFKQAVAFFAQDAKNGSSEINRSKLIVAIDYLLQKVGAVKVYGSTEAKIKDAKIIQEEIITLTDEAELKRLENLYLDAAVALKIAMGVFDMGKAEKEEK